MNVVDSEKVELTADLEKKNVHNTTMRGGNAM